MAINLQTSSGTGNNVGSTQLTTVARTTSPPVAINPIPVGTTTVAPITAPGEGTAGTTTNTQIDTFIVGTSTYMYMRPKTITFSVTGLKPNTQYYPFFNNVYVGDYCSTTDGAQSSPIFTNVRGDITGNFYLPGNLFPCGTHTFKLVDHYIEQPSGAKVADPLYGHVEAVYEASGILKQQQTQITSTSTVDLITLQPVNITLSTIFAASTPPGITAPSATVCEQWYFEYKVTSISTKTFSVSTMTSTAPVAPTPSTGAGAGGATAVTYLNTTVDGNGIYTHTYSYRFTTVTTYHQDWIGRQSDLTGPGNTPPIRLNESWRPSGISVNDVVEVLGTGNKWIRRGIVACPAALQVPVQVRWVDPLAQSFLVDSLLSPRGVFITSISVYFKTVDQSTPVVLELRDMVNGLPGSAILPGGKVVLPGYAAGQSNNATVATTFAFDQPIFLQPNKEYCFVLKSSSLGYNAWCSRLGGTDVTTEKIIDTQPYLGTLFKSENDSTWIPDSYEDLKFDLNVAVFDISKTGTTIFRPVIDSSGNYADLGQPLPLSYMSTTASSKNVVIRLPQHGLSEVGDKIFIAGLATTQNNTPIYLNGIRASNLTGEFVVNNIIDEDYVSIAANGTDLATITGPIVVGDTFGSIEVIPSPMPPATSIQIAEAVVNADNNSPTTMPAVPTTTVGGCTGSVGSKTISNNTNLFDPRVILVGSPVSGTNIAATAKVESINTVNNTITVDIPHTGNVNGTLTFVTTAPPIRPNVPTITSNTTFIVYTNALVNEGMIDYLGTEVAGTNINEYVATAEGFSEEGLTGATVPYRYAIAEQIEKDGRFHEFSQPRLIATPINELLHTEELTYGGTVNKSLEITLEMTSSDKSVSPIIDTNGMSFTTRAYKIDNQGGEIDDIFDTYSTAETLKAALNDPDQNSEIVPGQGTAAAKYKGPIVQTTDDYKAISLFVTGNCPDPAIFDVYIRTSADADTHTDQNWEWMPFKGDYAFNHKDNFAHSINKTVVNEWLFEYTSDAYFNVYDIKIVMRTTNNSIVPKIFGLRTIAKF